MSTESKSNIDPLMSKVAAAVQAINASKEARKEINAAILTQLDTMESEGIPKAAVRMAMTYLDWDERKQSGFDRAYAIVRKALGQPVQGDLLDWLATAPPVAEEAPAKEAPTD